MRFQFRLEKMDNHIASVTLDKATLGTATPKLQHERALAIAELIEGSYFSPKEAITGPYHLTFALLENRLVIAIDSAGEAGHTKIALPLKPLKMIIKDYNFICESYAKALETADPRKIEAIDMGRRGLHNEASELLSELLEDKVALDFDTARRLFTLIVVLHMK
jgi:uncharacterized protein (UPF0262 family)